MRKYTRKMLKAAVILFFVLGMMGTSVYAANRVGYVDLRRIFYEYDAAAEMRKEVNDFTERTHERRDELVKEITQLRDRSEMLTGEARREAQAQIDRKIMELQEYEQRKRQELLEKENEMFEKVIMEIEKVVTVMAEEENYDFVLDSRYIMYAKRALDLTDEVVRELNR